MKKFRKPLFPALLALLLLFVSCKQYDTEDTEVKNIEFNFDALRNQISEINFMLTDKSSIHKYDDFKNQLLSVNARGNNTITEQDISDAKNSLIDLGWQEGTSLDTDILIGNVADKMEQELMISHVTNLFIKNNLKDTSLNDYQQFNADIQSFIDSNNLTDFEKNLLLNLGNQNTALRNINNVACDYFGTAAGFLTGVLVASTGFGSIVSGLAGSFSGLAATSVCNAISAQL